MRPGGSFVDAHAGSHQTQQRASILKKFHYDPVAWMRDLTVRFQHRRKESEAELCELILDCGRLISFFPFPHIINETFRILAETFCDRFFLSFLFHLLLGLPILITSEKKAITWQGSTSPRSTSRPTKGWCISQRTLPQGPIEEGLEKARVARKRKEKVKETACSVRRVFLSIRLTLQHPSASPRVPSQRRRGQHPVIQSISQRLLWPRCFTNNNHVRLPSRKPPNAPSSGSWRSSWDPTTPLQELSSYVPLDPSSSSSANTTSPSITGLFFFFFSSH